MTLAANRRIAAIRHLDAFLAPDTGCVVGWGRKRSGARARWLAAALRRPWRLLEDGVLRSVEREGPLRSLMIDDLGVYYDARSPSRMEAAIADGVSAAEAMRAEAIRAAWCGAGLSKYNHCAEYAGALPADYVLVIDQCHGDLAVRCGIADARSFAAMLAAAEAEHPTRTIVIKTHPEVLAGARRGYLGPSPGGARRLMIGEACHPLRLIDGAAAVYTVTSLVGFEALLRGKPVRCFGMPFYAGWGLTQDALPRPARRGTASLAALVHAAFVALPRYVDPQTGVRWTAEQAIDAAARARAGLLETRAT